MTCTRGGGANVRVEAMGCSRYCTYGAWRTHTEGLDHGVRHGMRHEA